MKRGAQLFWLMVLVVLRTSHIGEAHQQFAHLLAQHNPYRMDEFQFVGVPTISIETYQMVYCQPRHGLVSDACAFAPQMYQLLVEAGIDPVIELAFAAKETEFGITGAGRSPQHNIHNIMCNNWDGGNCDGVYHARFSSYPSYLHAIQAWITLMLARHTYVDAGHMTFRQVIPIYAPAFENDTELYIAQTESWVRGWRAWNNFQEFPMTTLIWGPGIRLPPPPTLGDPRYLHGVLIAQNRSSSLDNPYLPDGAVAVDDADVGFSANQDTWAFERCGFQGKHLAASSTNDIQRSTSRASWVPSLPSPGRYEVQIYIPGCGNHEPTHSARYVITHDDGISSAIVNQRNHVGEWVSLGTYMFGKRFNPMVEVTNLTNDNNMAVRADAVAWFPSTKHSSNKPTGVALRYGGVPVPQETPTSIIAPMKLSLTHTQALEKSVVPLTNTPTLSKRVVPLSNTQALSKSVMVSPTFVPVGQSIAAILRSGYLRSEPRTIPETVMSQVCPGDEVRIFAEQSIGSVLWIQVQVVAISADCATNHTTVGAVGWVSKSLVGK